MFFTLFVEVILSKFYIYIFFKSTARCAWEQDGMNKSPKLKFYVVNRHDLVVMYFEEIRLIM